MDDRNWERLVEYFAGTLGPAETAELEEWISAERGRAAEIASLRRIWEASGQLPERYDTEMAWRRMAPQLAQSAAQKTRSQGTAETGRYRRGHKKRLVRAAAIVIGIGASSALLLRGAMGDRLFDRPVPIAEWTDHRTESGQRLGLQLADGTEVLLGPESRLLAPPRFQRSRREVRLEGTAYFTVRPNPERTFTVSAGRGVTEVLGTRFVVRAYPDEPKVHVAVEEGRVAIRTQVSPPDAAGAIVEAGHVGVVPASGSATVTDAVSERYLAWTEGRLVFEQTPVPEALRDLERWYGVEIRSLDPSLAEKHLTLTVGDEPLGSVLAVLAATLDVDYAHDDGVVTFRPSSL